MLKRSLLRADMESKVQDVLSDLRVCRDKGCRGKVQLSGYFNASG